jgi:predicted YcjX-like family ATPase
VSLEQHLAKERAVRKIVEEERDSMGQDWIKAMNNLEMQKAIDQDMTSYMAKAKAKY